MSLGSQIVERNFVQRDGELLIGGVTVSRIAAEHGTPLFIHDRDRMERKLAGLRAALPAGFDVYYSIKANPNQTILKYFVGAGCGLEIASGGEYYQAAAAGCATERILFAGPGKTPDELEYVLSHGIGEIHIESEQEIDTLAELCRRLGRSARVAVRVNPVADAQGGAMRMGGTASPFGVDEEILDRVLDRVLGAAGLTLSGIHLFTGTQILDHEVLVRQYRKGFELALRAARRADRSLETLDFGGGLGIPYFDNDSELDLAGLSDGLSELAAEHRDAPELRGTRFVIEPGRYLVGDSAVYVTRVTAVKQSRGKSFFVVDGGMNHHLAASGNLGQVIKRNFPSAIVNRLNDQPDGKANIVGPLCTPLDVLAREADLPAVKVGDLVGIFQSGAYARASSPLGFLSHPAPPEVLVHDGRVDLIRRRGNYDGFLEDQRQPVAGPDVKDRLG